MQAAFKSQPRLYTHIVCFILFNTLHKYVLLRCKLLENSHGHQVP